MQQYLKIAGNGQRSARDLTSNEAEEAFTLIMTGKASMAQLAAFMAVLRVKEESAVELAAFTRVARRFSQQLTHVLPNAIDICVPYDGRSKTPVLILAGALIAAACGAQVGFHGRLGQKTPPKFGVGVGDVMAHLGIPVQVSLVAAGDVLNRRGVAFCDITQFAPLLEAFHQVRLEFGMRSFLNTVEKLLNPFHAENALIGVFHYPLMRRVIEAVSQIGYKRTLVVQGSEGSIEALPSRHTPIMEAVTDQDSTEWTIDPHDYGWWDVLPPHMPSLTPSEQAGLTERILDPAASLPAYYCRGALLTAALMLYAAEIVPSLPEGIAQAQDALMNGVPQFHLKQLQGEKHYA